MGEGLQRSQGQAMALLLCLPRLFLDAQGLPMAHESLGSGMGCGDHDEPGR